MIRLRVSGTNFDPILELVDRLARPDLTPLAGSIRGIMIRDNRDGLTAGTDSYGHDMTRLEESTIRRGRGGDGPPLIPRGDASRAIADYDVEVQEGDDRLLLVGGWRNSPFIHFHATGTKHMVSRDPVGIRPSGEDEIRQALRVFAADLIGGRR